VYFDSLGKNPAFYPIGTLSNEKFSNDPSGMDVFFSRGTLQQPTSAVCGEYVCMFSVWLSKCVEEWRRNKEVTLVEFLANNHTPFDNLEQQPVHSESRQIRENNDSIILAAYKRLV